VRNKRKKRKRYLYSSSMKDMEKQWLLQEIQAKSKDEEVVS